MDKACDMLTGFLSGDRPRLHHSHSPTLDTVLVLVPLCERFESCESIVCMYHIHIYWLGSCLHDVWARCKKERVKVVLSMFMLLY